MSNVPIVPYGSWKSPIQAGQIASASLRLGHVTVVGDEVYWNELRPMESGRCVVVRRSVDGRMTDMIPAPFNARTRVHEYGGASYVTNGKTLFFSNFSDQRAYRCDDGRPPLPITPEVDMRYADGIMDSHRNRLIYIREDHTRTGHEPFNTIVAITPDTMEQEEILVMGNDFYSSPRLSPDGSQLAWLTWNHPNMPWDATELWVAPVCADGMLGEATRVASGKKESVLQPEWSPQGVLHFTSDKTDFWNLYRWSNGMVEQLTNIDAEFATPPWVFGMSSYAFCRPDEIVCACCRKGLWNLAILNTASRALRPIETEFNTISDVRAGNGTATFVAGSPTDANAIVQMNLQNETVVVLRRSSDLTFDPGYISAPELIEFHTEGGRTAYGFFYPPKNKDYSPPAGEKPPLLVMSHGGPTSATTAALRAGIQFYTSRGIAVLDVNYGGSTGHGRAYRERLKGHWGIVDVDDCANGAQHLAKAGRVDAKRLAITGGSAGGYTTLAALTFRNVFHAGSSHFGVSDCEALARETHKFESRYLDSLIGPYPERRDLYLERSPLQHADRLSCPVIFFQGLEDRIVPPNQAEKMVAVLRAKGIPVSYVPFEGEQHGFRRAANIQRALEAELYFFSRIFGFALAEPVEPVEIDNLTTS